MAWHVVSWAKVVMTEMLRVRACWGRMGRGQRWEEQWPFTEECWGRWGEVKDGRNSGHSLVGPTLEAPTPLLLQGVRDTDRLAQSLANLRGDGGHLHVCPSLYSSQHPKSGSRWGNRLRVGPRAVHCVTGRTGTDTPVTGCPCLSQTPGKGYGNGEEGH